MKIKKNLFLSEHQILIYLLDFTHVVFWYFLLFDISCYLIFLIIWYFSLFDIFRFLIFHPIWYFKIYCCVSINIKTVIGQPHKILTYSSYLWRPFGSYRWGWWNRLNGGTASDAHLSQDANCRNGSTQANPRRSRQKRGKTM